MTVPFSHLTCPSLCVFIYAFNVTFLRKGLAPPPHGFYYPTACNIIEMVEVEAEEDCVFGIL